jgi:hypothetical protein
MVRAYKTEVRHLCTGLARKRNRSNCDTTDLIGQNGEPLLGLFWKNSTSEIANFTGMRLPKPFKLRIANCETSLAITMRNIISERRWMMAGSYTCLSIDSRDKQRTWAECLDCRLAGAGQSTEPPK